MRKINLTIQTDNDRDPVLTVTLNPAVDVIYQIPHLHRGKEYPAGKAIVSAGGKGINVARSLKSLGVSCLAGGLLGGLRGQEIKDQLLKEKIPFRFTRIEQNSRTAWTILTRNPLEITRVIEDGPRIKTKDIERFKQDFQGLLKRCSAVVLCGKKIPGAPDQIYADLIRTAKRHGKKVILDTSGNPLRLGLKAEPYLVKPNSEEVRDVLGKTLTGPRDAAEALKVFLQKGCAKVIISLGRQGAVGSDGKKMWMAVPPRVRILNPVGCGDALLAGFLYGELNNMPFSEALRFGVATGSTNLLTVIPGQIQRRDLLKIRPRVKLMPLAD